MQKFSEIPYQRPDLNNVKDQFQSIIEEMKVADNFDKQVATINKMNNTLGDVYTMYTLASIRHSIDTTDSFYDTENTFFDENTPELKKYSNDFNKLICDSPFREALIKHFGNQLFVVLETEMKSFDAKIIEDLGKENKLATSYEKLIASAKIQFDGKELNLSGLSPYMQSKDRDVRKEASKASANFFTENMEQLDSIYDNLVHTRDEISKKLGFKNFVEVGYMRMCRSDYNANDVAVFRQEVLEHIVPIAQELVKRQSKRIGIDEMKYYDLSLEFKTGNPTPKGEPAWIIENGKKMYNELSKETGEFFNFLLDNELMDLVNKKGKRGGGYCTFINKYKAPFIFSNFNGTSHDIDVLTHEAGHAFQVYQSRNLPVPEYFWPTTEACEIHSMSMEFLTWNWMELFFKEDTEKYKYSHLARCLSFLPYGVSVDEFQHEVYQNPDMTPAERRALWRRIEKKYLPYKDYDGIEYLENGGFWQRQAHIYMMPFYYIDYCLAQVCAFQFWIKMQKDFDAAWQDYLTLCKAGGSLSFVDLVKLAKLRSPFEKGCLKEVALEIKAWLDQVDDTKF